MPKDIVKVSWSGGKDSTCAVMKHLERGDTVKAVCYIPMFTDTIPLICKDHYRFILDTADLFNSMGADVYFVYGMTYWDFVHFRRIKGKRKGVPIGFPCFVTSKCSFRIYSKAKAIEEMDVGPYDYTDIGIAIDEKRRHGQLNEYKRSILCELGMTEDDAKKFCLERGVLSPHYNHETRDGCMLCPQKSKKHRERWFNDYPEAVPLVAELQRFVLAECEEQYPLRNHRWFLEDENGAPITK